MSLHLYLLRHAQSADKQTGQTDKERMLTTLGLAEASEVGKYLKEKSLVPELIITSSALRAKTTSEVVAEILGYTSESIVIKDELYEANVSTFFQILAELDHPVNSVLIVGHNPVISFFADHLCNQQNSFFPSEILALKSEAASWKEVQKENTEVTGRFHPSI